MDGYYITVKSNLIEQKHIDAMQVSQKTTALWMYLWFLDKMTEIDPETHLGIVLGGKPLKIKNMGIAGNLKTRRKIFHNLMANGYIVTKRTSYGYIVYITKAYKVFGQKYGNSVEKPGMSLPKSGRSDTKKFLNLVGLVPKSGRSGFGKTERSDNREGLDTCAIFSDKTVDNKEINNKEKLEKTVENLMGDGYIEAHARIDHIRQKPGIGFDEWFKQNRQTYEKQLTNSEGKK